MVNSNGEFLYNAKIKVYKNGFKNICVCSSPIWTKKTQNDDKFDLLSEFPVLVCPLDYIEKEEKEKSEFTRSDSIKRAVDSVFDYALNNDFNFFLTLTFDPKKVDSYDFDLVNKKAKNWFYNQQKRYNISYLAIAELHSSGRVHFHALINDKTGKFFSRCINSGHFDNNGRIIYNCDSWYYGFSTAVMLDDNIERLARYVTKYMTKSLKKIMGKMYWHSSDLVRPDVQLTNIDFDSFDAVEYSGFKYKFDSAKTD